MVNKKQWEAYRKVQTEGKYNMLDPQAHTLTGLSDKDYWYIIEHYMELLEQFDETI